MDVGGQAEEVLRAADASYMAVDARVAEAGVDDDGANDAAGGLQQMLAAVGHVGKHVGFNYGIVVDKSGSDVCRACFLPWDSECFINSKYISNVQ